jgi:hypothetical protein
LDFRAKSLLRGLSGDSEGLADFAPAHAVSPAIRDCKIRQALDLASADGERSKRDDRLVCVREQKARFVSVSARVALVPRHRADCTPGRSAMLACKKY